MKLTLNLKPILSAFFLLAVQTLRAQSPAGNDQSLLWKISGNGLKNDSYILLTTSNTCADVAALDKKTLAVLGKVQVVGVESGLLDPANEAKLQKLVTVKNQNESVKKVLSASLYSQLNSEAANVGMNEVRLNSYKPIVICGMTIKVINPCEIKDPKTPETLIRAYAHDKSIKVTELLSLEETFDTFNAYPNSYWEKTLDFLINNSSQASSDLDSKSNFYTHENFRGICAIINKSPLLNLRYSFNDIEAKRINLLDSRIENVIKNQSSILLLDVADVANPGTSIFNSLKKSGYIISPIYN
ncbi:TraB/GumN family protein [Mucilaginibacter sp.]|uniref:TraB/GumN family protein n=1 Tax=Mucilaginibacter sp. TaxID=1882438 RepID=UPI002ED0A2B3